MGLGGGFLLGGCCAQGSPSKLGSFPNTCGHWKSFCKFLGSQPPSPLHRREPKAPKSQRSPAEPEVAEAGLEPSTGP